MDGPLDQLDARPGHDAGNEIVQPSVVAKVDGPSRGDCHLLTGPISMSLTGEMASNGRRSQFGQLRQWVDSRPSPSHFRLPFLERVS